MWQGTLESNLTEGASVVAAYNALGYDAAAKVAKSALAENKTVRQYVLEHKLIEPKRLDQLLDPTSMTEPGGEGAGGG